MKPRFLTTLLIICLAASCRTVREEGRGEMQPTSLQFRFVSAEPRPGLEAVIDKGSGSTLYASREILFNEKDLLWAKAQCCRDTRSWGIEFALNRDAGDRFAKLTEEHIGQRLGVFINGQLVSAPKIMARIPGRGVINGLFGEADARELAEGLNAAATKAK